MQAVTELQLAQIQANGYSFSPAHYTDVAITSPTTTTVRALLDPTTPYERGSEPGSSAYLSHSSHHMIRTKALQRHSWLVDPRGDAIVPISPRAFVDGDLAINDILLSKDSNVGEVALVDEPRSIQHMRSGGVLKLRPASDPFYLFAFLKHPSFVAQLEAATPRGSTIRHAGERWLDCVIPLPNQRDSDDVVAYVSAMTEAIADKERLIRERTREIHRTIGDELRRGRRWRSRPHTMPSIHEIAARGRFDAAIYDREYKGIIDLVDAYEHGAQTPNEAGFDVNPGPTLELKVIKTRIDSDEPRPGYYALLLPKNLSEYGTINRLQYLGTAAQLPLLQDGDVLFGEAGFHKGRSVVLVQAPAHCTTNAHGIYARHRERDLDAAIMFRCIFDWYREMGVVDLVAVGGSGGHLSPSYFDEYIRVPNFSREIRERIVPLYHTGDRVGRGLPLAPGELARRHRERNAQLGIWELSADRALLIRILRELQAAIVRGEPVDLAGFADVDDLSRSPESIF